MPCSISSSNFRHVPHEIVAAHKSLREQYPASISSLLPAKWRKGDLENTARGLLQAEQETDSAQQAKIDATHTVAEAQTTSSADQNMAAGMLSATETKLKMAALPDALQPNIQQYQPSNMPLIDTDRLIAAAAAQASQLMVDSVQKHEGEDDFDAWPLIDPPFEEALHEASKFILQLTKAAEMHGVLDRLCVAVLWQQ